MLWCGRLGCTILQARRLRHKVLTSGVGVPAFDPSMSDVCAAKATMKRSARRLRKP